MDNIKNCIIPDMTKGPGWAPHTPWTSASTLTLGLELPSTNTLSIRKVENGYVINFNNQEYVFVNEYDIAAFITKNLTK